jgi:hypothetical protein
MNLRVLLVSQVIALTNALQKLHVPMILTVLERWGVNGDRACFEGIVLSLH